MMVEGLLKILLAEVLIVFEKKTMSQNLYALNGKIILVSLG